MTIEEEINYINNKANTITIDYKNIHNSDNLYNNTDEVLMSVNEDAEKYKKIRSDNFCFNGH